MERQNTILKRSRGFVYAVSALGVTGARSVLPDQMFDRIAKLKATSRSPIAIGFGLSSPEMAARAAQVADGIIVGSAFIEQMTPELTEDEQVDRAVELIRIFHQATFVKTFTEHIERPSL
jgi:tryptophan synthase alpha chain